MGRGGSPWGPKGWGWGKVVCPAPRGGARMGKGNNHAGRGRRSHPPAPPRPIAIRLAYCSIDNKIKFFFLALFFFINKKLYYRSNQVIYIYICDFFLHAFYLSFSCQCFLSFYLCLIK